MGERDESKRERGRQRERKYPSARQRFFVIRPSIEALIVRWGPLLHASVSWIVQTIYWGRKGRKMWGPVHKEETKENCPQVAISFLCRSVLIISFAK